MIRVAVAAGALVWGLVVFEATRWLTFPADAVGAWITHEVATRMPGSTAEIGSVRPWWTGVTLHDVKVFSAPTVRSEDGAAVPTLLALAERVRGRVSPWSILRGGYDLRGDVTFVEGQADIEVGLRPDERGRMNVTRLVVFSEEMPLAEILPLLPLAEVPLGTGNLRIDVEVVSGEAGLRQATGHLSVTGSNLVISDVTTETTGPLDLEFPISQLKLEAPIEDGKATVSQGIVTSDLATLEVTGSLLLRDPLSRSSLDLQLAISNLGPTLQPLASLMGTPHADGRYHFTVRGLASRPSFTPMRETGVSSSSSGRVSGSGTVLPSMDPSTPGYTSPSLANETDAEKEKRREEARERLRQRREERDAQAADIMASRGRPPVETDEGDEGDLGDEGFELDEEPDDALPVDDLTERHELPLDDPEAEEGEQ